MLQRIGGAFRADDGAGVGFVAAPGADDERVGERRWRMMAKAQNCVSALLTPDPVDGCSAAGLLAKVGVSLVLTYLFITFARDQLVTGPRSDM